MRPNDDSKIFNGGVYSTDNPPMIRADTSKDAKVIVATPIEIPSEWRFFVVQREIIAATSYRIESRPSVEGCIPPEAHALAKDVSKAWGPSEVYCMDVGYDGKRYGIIEANCFNASRIYGANVNDIVTKVTEFTRERYNT